MSPQESPRSLLRTIAFLAWNNRITVPIRVRAKRLRKWWRSTLPARQQRRAVGYGQRLIYLFRELFGEPGVERVYRLRESNLRAVLRHRTDDTAVLGEIVLRGDYVPPDAARRAFETTAPRVVSLGGHIGLFGLDCFRRWPDARITEVEADPENAALFRRNVERNGLADRWGLIEAFATTRGGFREVLRGHGTSLVRAAAGGPPVEAEKIEVPAIDVFPLLNRADLIKMDIEGGEWEILMDSRFNEVPARAIVLEHHHQLCPDPSPRAAATRALEAAGFRVIPLRMKPNEVGMLWGVRD